MERQLQIAREWWAREIAPLGTPLEEMACDEGLSAWKGEHVEKGSLGHFLAEIKVGRIATGSILIAENLDRISRQGPKIARKLIEQIVDNGVDVHIVNISMKLTRNWENDNSRSIIVDIELGRALKESEHKSARIGQSWRSNKQKTAEGRALTANTPAWLKVENGKIVERPDRVAAVKEMFRLASLGIGSRNITRAINNGLTLSWVMKTLNNRSVLGEYQPSRVVAGKKVPEGEVIFNYYPQIISQSEWDAARAEMARKAPKGMYRAGSRTSNVADNLFTGLIYDKTTEPERSMNFQRKSKARCSWLISAWDKEHKGNRMRYDKFETAFLVFLTELDWKSVAGSTESDECKAAQFRLNQVLGELDKTNRRIAAKTAAMDGDLDVPTLQVLAGQVAKDEAKATELFAEKDALSTSLEVARTKCEALYTPETLLALIQSRTPETNDVRLRLRNEIRRRVEKIGINFSKTGSTTATIVFVNGARKAVIFKGDSITLAQQVSFERPEIVPAA